MQGDIAMELIEYITEQFPNVIIIIMNFYWGYNLNRWRRVISHFKINQINDDKLLIGHFCKIKLYDREIDV